MLRKRNPFINNEKIGANECNLDFTFIEEPIETIILDEYSTDYSVISSESITSDSETKSGHQQLTDKHISTSIRQECTTNLNGTLIFEDDHFNYYPVCYHPWSTSTCLVQLATFTGLVAILPCPIGGLILAYSFDNFINILVYLGKYHWKGIEKFFYTEQISVKLIYFFLVNLPIYLLYSLTCLMTKQLLASLPTEIRLLDTYTIYIETMILIVVNLPCVVNWVVNHQLFRKYYYLVTQELHFLGRSLICKKVSQAINKVSIKYLSSDPNISGRELMQTLPLIHVSQLLSFVCASAIALVLFYFELDGVKFYTILIRQYYFREYLDINRKKRRRQRANNHEYICDIIQKREWSKFTDPYTLNRLLKLYLEINSRENGGLFYSDSSPTERATYWLARVVSSMSVASIFSPKLAPTFYMVDTIKELVISRQKAKALPQMENGYEVTISLVGGDAESEMTVLGKTKRDRMYYLWIAAIRCLVICCYWCLLTINNEVILLVLSLELGFLLLGNQIFVKLCKEICKIVREQVTGQWPYFD